MEKEDKIISRMRDEWLAQVDQLRREKNLSVVTYYKTIMAGKKNNLWRHGYVGDAKTFEAFVEDRFGVSARRLSKMGEIVERFTRAEIEAWGYEGCSQICSFGKNSEEDKSIREAAHKFESQHHHPPSDRWFKTKVIELRGEKKSSSGPETSTDTRIRERALEADKLEEKIKTVEGIIALVKSLNDADLFRLHAEIESLIADRKRKQTA